MLCDRRIVSMHLMYLTSQSHHRLRQAKKYLFHQIAYLGEGSLVDERSEYLTEEVIGSVLYMECFQIEQFRHAYQRIVS